MRLTCAWAGAAAVGLWDPVKQSGSGAGAGAASSGLWAEPGGRSGASLVLLENKHAVKPPFVASILFF